MTSKSIAAHIQTTFPAGVAFWTDVVISLGGTYIAPNLPDPHAEKIEALMEEALAQGLLLEPQLGVLVANRATTANQSYTASKSSNLHPQGFGVDSTQGAGHA